MSRTPLADYGLLREAVREAILERGWSEAVDKSRSRSATNHWTPRR
jgi:hypothetical protein